MSEAVLLGAPLTEGPALDLAWSERCSDQSRALERLKLIASQDALILLKASFSAPRVQHLLRCSPSAGNAALGSFDELLRTSLSYLTNCDLSNSEWIQASLPVRDGALESDGCLCSHFLPFWHQRLAPSVFRMKSSSNVIANQMTHSLTRT